MCKQILEKSTRYVERSLLGSVVLVPTHGDLPNGEVVQLDAVSKEIWNLIDGSRSVLDIAHILTTEYSVDEGTLIRDISAFCSSLVDIKALREEERSRECR